MSSPARLANNHHSVSTLLAFLLDIYVFRQATRLGKYQGMKDADVKNAEPVYQDHNMAEYNDAQEMSGGVKSGYSAPQEQFGYDTSYTASRTGFRD
jgi:hypothetical protein